MKRLRQTALLASLMGSTLFWVACASTKMESIQRAPEFEVGRLHKVLVVGAFKRLSVRKAFERECVRQWKARGVTAVASVSVIPVFEPLSQLGEPGFAQSRGFDTVLVTRLMNRARTQPPIANPPAHVDAIMTEEESHLTPYIQAIEASPDFDQTYPEAILKTNLYNASTGQRVWSGTSGALATRRFQKVIAPCVEAILRALYENP